MKLGEKGFCQVLETMTKKTGVTFPAEVVDYDAKIRVARRVQVDDDIERRPLFEINASELPELLNSLITIYINRKY